MFKQLGLAVYIGTFRRQKEALLHWGQKGAYVFTSFHIQEEWEADDAYCRNAIEMCRFLKQAGFRIIADVSPKTLKFFGHAAISPLAAELGLDILRLDYGFSLEDILAIDHPLGIAFNASTLNPVEAEGLIAAGKQVLAMHNYYPRPETGLDDAYFRRVNQVLKALGVKILAFIPGDAQKRGPLHEGLPTLEHHRRLPPYLGFLDLAINYGIDGIFLADPGLSPAQEQLIRRYLTDGVITVPVELAPEYAYLDDRTFTIRVDSPARLMRLQESREYSCGGAPQEPRYCMVREAGAITMDNQNYGRYSGEIQILREQLPQDDRVNVIGRIIPAHLSVVDCIKNGMRIRLERE